MTWQEMGPFWEGVQPLCDWSCYQASVAPAASSTPNVASNQINILQGKRAGEEEVDPVDIVSERLRTLLCFREYTERTAV